MRGATRKWALLAAAVAITAALGPGAVASEFDTGYETGMPPEYFSPGDPAGPVDARYFANPGLFPPMRLISYAKTIAPQSPWYFLTEGVALKRDAAHEQSFAAQIHRRWREVYEQRDDLPAPPTFVGWDYSDYRTDLGTADFDFDLAGGGNFLIGRRLGDWYGIEVSYMTVNSWDELAAMRDDTDFQEELLDATGAPLLNGYGYPQPGTVYTGSLFSPFSNFGNPAILGLDYNNAVTLRYSSQFYDVEWNLRRTLAMPPEGLQVSLLVGGRYMNIRERFQYHTSSYYPVAPTTNDIGVSTSNGMLGAQIGALFEFHIEPCWWGDVEIKGAIFDNFARQDTTYVNDSGGVQASYTGGRSGHRTTFALDLDAALGWQINSWLTGRVGYQAIWINGLALASENFQSDVGILTLGPAVLNTNGNVVYHGPHIGVTGAW